MKTRSLRIDQLESRRLMAADITADTFFPLTGPLTPTAPIDPAQVLVAQLVTSPGAAPIVIGDNLPAGVPIRVSFEGGVPFDELVTTHGDQDPREGVALWINDEATIGMRGSNYLLNGQDAQGFGLAYDNTKYASPSASASLVEFAFEEVDEVMTLGIDIDDDGEFDYLVADNMAAGTRIRMSDGSFQFTTHADQAWATTGQISFAAHSSTGVVIGGATDLDGDGDADSAFGFDFRYRSGLRSLNVDTDVAIA